MAARSIQSRKGRHYLIEFGIDKELAIVSEDDVIFGCASCGHQAGEAMEVYVIDKGNEKDIEKNEKELDSDEELEPLAKKQRKETDAKYSKEAKMKESKRRQHANQDDFAVIDDIYPGLQSNVTASSEPTDDVTITKVVQASGNKCSSGQTPPGSHSKAPTSVPLKTIESPFLLKDYCSVIENIKARINKIEDFLSIYFGYKRNDDNSPQTQLPQSSLASRFMPPPLTDQFLGPPPLINNTNPPNLTQQSRGSSVNLTKPGSSVNHIKPGSFGNHIQVPPTQQASVTLSHPSPHTQKFPGTSTHNNTQPPTAQQSVITPQSYIQIPKQPMPLPQSQPPPPPFHVPAHLLKPNLLFLKQQSVSRSNFAKKLLASLISEDEWITLNVSGTRGKKQINPQVIDYVKLCAFFMYPLGPGENMETAWKVCVKAIDAGARAIAKRKRQST